MYNSLYILYRIGRQVFSSSPCPREVINLIWASFGDNANAHNGSRLLLCVPSSYSTYILFSFRVRVLPLPSSSVSIGIIEPRRRIRTFESSTTLHVKTHVRFLFSDSSSDSQERRIKESKERCKNGVEGGMKERRRDKQHPSNPTNRTANTTPLFDSEFRDSLTFFSDQTFWKIRVRP